MPSRCQNVVTYHVLYRALFTVGELDLRLFLADARTLPADRARFLFFFRTLAWSLATNCAGLWLLPFALTRLAAALLARFRFQRLAVPFRVAEMQVRLHEVVDGEVVLAVVKPCAAPDDLLELDHAIDRAHQNDVADVAGINAGRELLRGGQNRRNGPLIVPKSPVDIGSQSSPSFAVTRWQ